MTQWFLKKKNPNLANTDPNHLLPEGKNNVKAISSFLKKNLMCLLTCNIYVIYPSMGSRLFDNVFR
jgi:hypothetical protein